ncbi:MAG: hypothetical protein HC892_02550 [Saprospiraceae bacterium]|nr:hypothetical protein [Saprospiraceae bacterium]
MDVTTPLATDSVILNVPTFREQRLGLGVEYIFDNTLDVALNIKNGTRYKLYAELVKQFDLDLLGNEGLDVKDGFMTILGLDFRHYQRLDKNQSLLCASLAQLLLVESKFYSESAVQTTGYSHP